MKNFIKYIIILLLALKFNIKSQTEYIFKFETKEKFLPHNLIANFPVNKPTISLALSGGGARGISQIGVLKALVENGIEPDIIVGTSMGGIIGGLYSAGYSVEQLEKIAINTNWNELLTFNNRDTRKDLFIDQKIAQDRSLLTLRLEGLTPIIPTSFNDGQKLSNYLNILTFEAPIHSDEDFDKLKVKFRAVCTNLVTGEMVEIKKGSLSKALRASSSVTFFLAPVKYDSLILVDGGLVANVPVESALKENADIVIAVDVTSPLWKESDLEYPWIVADQIVSIPIRKLNKKQIDLADFVITPDLKNFSATNFEKIDSLIYLGYAFSTKIAKKIKNKIHSIYESKISKEKIYFSNITYDESFDSTEVEFFRNELLQEDFVSNTDIQICLEKLFLTGYYKNLSLKASVSPEKTILSLIKEKNPIVKNLMLIGISKIPTETINEIFKDVNKQPLNNIKLSEALTKLISIYRQEGLSLAKVQEIKYDEDNNRLIVFIDEGIISEIKVWGNNKTETNVILRELPFDVGDFFKIVDIDKGLRNLRSTGLFEFVEITVEEISGRNVLNVYVTERPTGLIRIFNRTDNDYKFQLGIDIREENLFGTGSEVGLTFFTGSRNRSLLLENKSNRIFNTYLTYKLSIFHSFRDIYTFETKQINDTRFSRNVNGEYRQIEYGASISVGTQVERFGNLIFEGKYKIDQIKNLINNNVLPYNTKFFSLKISSTVDTQDKFPFPEKGIYFNGYYETAQSFLISDFGYTVFSFDYKNYLKIFNDNVISTKFKWGFADKTLPLSQHFSIGGQDSFFGLRDFESRGRQIFLTSLSYRLKVPFKIFFPTYLSARYDLGNVWENQEQIRFKDLKHGIGASISLDTPIGPAEFSIGRSFIIKNTIPKNQLMWGDLLFYFSIGYYY
ncbi:MAG: patatin-like phospholipase family protein [Ignavibacterium sp.]|nr:patatin-like phospholipase family protein [Ignavibacterium sp.]MCX7610537.1 patatin-like phospholipase family protein [Ignavibacterium sp.]MDW8374598.1 patatin-like phospholipase family protein [Ignavibacteriales bacterium]